MSAKLDLYKLHKNEYITPKQPQLVNVGPAHYLAIEGKGTPGGDEFTAKVGALYGMAFTIKMARKKQTKQDYAVCKLEGLWWAPPKGVRTMADWHWKLLIRTPDFITESDRQAAIAALTKKDKGPEVKNVRLETLNEGLCLQMLHVGPYTEEAADIALMKEFAAGEGLKPHGLHHEIYLSDPRRVPAAKLKTILRQPVK